MTWFLLIAGAWLLTAVVGGLFLAMVIRSADGRHDDPSQRPLPGAPVRWGDGSTLSLTARPRPLPGRRRPRSRAAG